MSVYSPVLDFIRGYSYRYPMLVKEVIVFPELPNEGGYYFCPRCQTTMERDFMKYCDRCGQCLDWSQYEQAEVVYPGRKKRGAKATRFGSTFKFRFHVKESQ